MSRQLFKMGRSQLEPASTVSTSTWHRGAVPSMFSPSARAVRTWRTNCGASRRR
ncbi:MAG: hypothetical protein HS126_39975 [Anaerolineales bacterium]|nr:hypothetical protein [Anaerolineales bacterium]